MGQAFPLGGHHPSGEELWGHGLAGVGGAGAAAHIGKPISVMCHGRENTTPVSRSIAAGNDKAGDG